LRNKKTLHPYKGTECCYPLYHPTCIASHLNFKYEAFAWYSSLW